MRSARPRNLLGEALRGLRRESVEIATKVCLPVGDGPNDRGLSRKHVMESCHASLRRLGTITSISIRPTATTRVPRWTKRWFAFDDLVRQGKVLYLGVSEWTAPQIRAALELAEQLGRRSRIVANQPQYSMLWRVIEAEAVVSMAQLAIAWTLHRPGVSAAIIGASRPEQVAETSGPAGCASTTRCCARSTTRSAT